MAKPIFQRGVGCAMCLQQTPQKPTLYKISLLHSFYIFFHLLFPNIATFSSYALFSLQNALTLFHAYSQHPANPNSSSLLFKFTIEKLAVVFISASDKTRKISEYADIKTFRRLLSLSIVWAIFL